MSGERDMSKFEFADTKYMKGIDRSMMGKTPSEICSGMQNSVLTGAGSFEMSEAQRNQLNYNHTQRYILNLIHMMDKKDSEIESLKAEVQELKRREAERGVMIKTSGDYHEQN